MTDQKQKNENRKMAEKQAKNAKATGLIN